VLNFGFSLYGCFVFVSVGSCVWVVWCVVLHGCTLVLCVLVLCVCVGVCIGVYCVGVCVVYVLCVLCVC